MQKSDKLRHIVVDTFAEFGFPNAESCYEAIFVRDGFHVGRQFRCERVRAVWLFDQDVVNFYRDEKLVKVVPIKAALPEIKRVA